MARKRKTNPVKEIVVNEEKRSEDALQQIRNLTAEFFDHAVLLVSREVNGKTEFLHASIGNEFAIKGMVEVFVNEYMEDKLQDEMEDGEWEGEWADDDEDESI
ncbi:hypothetical protein EBZ39_06485 [bacterium]|nr:hypothetical protein [bacterium]